MLTLPSCSHRGSTVGFGAERGADGDWGTAAPGHPGRLLAYKPLRPWCCPHALSEEQTLCRWLRGLGHRGGTPTSSRAGPRLLSPALLCDQCVCLMGLPPSTSGSPVCASELTPCRAGVRSSPRARRRKGKAGGRWGAGETRAGMWTPAEPPPLPTCVSPAPSRHLCVEPCSLESSLVALEHVRGSTTRRAGLLGVETNCSPFRGWRGSVAHL